MGISPPEYRADTHPTLRPRRSAPIGAPPERVWPWLVQMGRGRAGFYGLDLLDNGGDRSARELRPAIQALSAGDRLVAGARGDIRVEVLLAEEPDALVLGGVR